MNWVVKGLVKCVFLGECSPLGIKLQGVHLHDTQHTNEEENQSKTT